MSELLPCPFCGSTRAPEVSDVGECEECANFDGCLHRQENHTCEGCDEWERPMFVVCNYNISGCGVSGPYRRTEAKAIAAWNTRTATTDAEFARAVHDGNLWRRVKGHIRCRNCGLNIESVIALDGCNEHAIKHCPNCGAKVVDR